MTWFKSGDCEEVGVQANRVAFLVLREAGCDKVSNLSHVAVFLFKACAECQQGGVQPPVLCPGQPYNHTDGQNGKD